MRYFAKSQVLLASKSLLASTDKQDFQKEKVSQEVIMVQTWVLNSNSTALLVGVGGKDSQEGCQIQYIRSMCAEASSQGGSPQLMLFLTLLGSSAA